MITKQLSILQNHPYHHLLLSIVEKANEIPSGSIYHLGEVHNTRSDTTTRLVQLIDTITDTVLLSALPDPRSAKRKISGVLPGTTKRIRKTQKQGKFSTNWISLTVAWRFITFALGPYDPSKRISRQAETILTFLADLPSYRSIIEGNVGRCPCCASLPRPIPEELQRQGIQMFAQMQRLLREMGLDPGTLDTT